MKPGGIKGFYERGGYLLPYDGGQVYVPGMYPAHAVGEVEALGNRGGGFEDCSGVPGQLVVGVMQIAWAVQWTGPLRYSGNFVGNIYLPDIQKLRWKDRVLRVDYVHHVERVPGILLARFRNDLGVEWIKAGLQGQTAQ